MVVHTFYLDIGARDAAMELATWARSWERNGWQPRILTSDVARQHPQFDALVARVRSWPTVNHPEYTLSNFMRWAAMEVVGGGLLVDYDIINRKFNPGDLEALRLHSAALTALDANPVCPVPAVGGKSAYAWAVRRILEYERGPEDSHAGRPHTCDMFVVGRAMQRHPGPCCIIGEAGWGKAPLLHLNNDAWRRFRGQKGYETFAHTPRWEVMDIHAPAR